MASRKIGKILAGKGWILVRIHPFSFLQILLYFLPQSLKNPFEFGVVGFKEGGAEALEVAVEAGKGDNADTGRAHKVIDESFVR